ncbi:hypothetical protein U2150_03970 [Methanothermobacter wolfeii]|uniref:Uncharacterized protein n=1 Tax=Methanothermobacter wolfeii TaxID=145261 RepID=A0A9E7RRF0_METWO|nr:MULTISPECIES: hypothetical protein [Methanothermobacter]MDI6701396.1 hypothetical protein [Methanothermobacter wolfeii]MDI6842055.1 hypothetical protein [Methanothermobacter wolfeii]NLM03133.1 hypothetical protein [Methanothermobacter wolfeii]QHN06465.1 hypothetical protein FZP57_04940 [Methanothermobacter sp. THM-1]UXH30963.1 hypothetical protein N5910_05290 [Methanothermobacter wolfeii]
MVAGTFTGSVIYSHGIPAVLGFISMLLICNGVMDENREQLLGGVGLFFAAGLLPFIILPLILGI